MTVLLAVDFGEKRTGVALIETETGVVAPLTTVARRSDAQLVGELGDLAASRSAESFVLGLPVGLDGEEATAAARIRSFSHKLHQATGREVVLVSETLTSHEARSRMGARAAKRGQLDAVAAQIIGEQYLSAETPPTAPSVAEESR